MANQIRYFLLSLVLGTSLALAAPQNGGPALQDKDEHAVRLLSRKLALTADQQSQVLNIMRDHRQLAENIKADATLSPKQQRVRLRDARLDMDGKMRSVLTPEQQTAYEQIKADRRARAQERRQTAVPQN